MIWQSGLVNKSVVVGTYHMPGIKLLIARQRVLIRINTRVVLVRHKIKKS